MLMDVSYDVMHKFQLRTYSHACLFEAARIRAPLHFVMKKLLPIIKKQKLKHETNDLVISLKRAFLFRPFARRNQRGND